MMSLLLFLLSKEAKRQVRLHVGLSQHRSPGLHQYVISRVLSTFLGDINILNPAGRRREVFIQNTNLLLSQGNALDICADL